MADLSESHLDNLLSGYSSVVGTDDLPRMIAELRRHRSAIAASKERIMSAKNSMCPGCGELFTVDGFDLVTVTMAEDPGAHGDWTWHRRCRAGYLRWTDSIASPAKPPTLDKERVREVVRAAFMERVLLTPREPAARAIADRVAERLAVRVAPRTEYQEHLLRTWDDHPRDCQDCLVDAVADHVSHEQPAAPDSVVQLALDAALARESKAYEMLGRLQREYMMLKDKLAELERGKP